MLCFFFQILSLVMRTHHACHLPFRSRKKQSRSHRVELRGNLLENLDVCKAYGAHESIIFDSFDSNFFSLLMELDDIDMRNSVCFS